MDKEFITYEQALALKELGFEYEKFYNYTSPMTNLAPLKQQVFRWFREKYDSQCDIWQYEDNLSFAFSVKIKFKRMDAEIGFKTYEEAENACIDKLIEIAKQQDND
jgi:hypothetical protein